MASEGHAPTIRNWRDVAEELSRENDSERIGKLSEELLRAIDAQKGQGTATKLQSESQKQAAS